MADNWWSDEAKLLISLWGDLAVQEKLNSMHNKKPIWEQISAKMAAAGYTRSAQQCRIKINNLKQKYRKVRDSNRESGKERHEWEYFEAMDVVLGCKPSSEPLVLVDSMLKYTGECTSENSECSYAYDEEVFALLNADKDSVAESRPGSSLSEVDSESNSSSTTANHVGTGAVVKPEKAGDTYRKPGVKESKAGNPSKKRKKPQALKADKITEALASFSEAQREQQQIFLDMEERRSQRELELEEKRMKLEHEQEKRREDFMMEMMKVLAQAKNN